MEETYVPAPVPFQGGVVYMVKHENKPYVPMKPVVEGMGLAWQPQIQKLKNTERFNHVVIPLQTMGGVQKMLCIPLNMLNGWLFSVNPEKVKPELRDQVILYQQESFQVLYDYWNNGMAENPRKSDKMGHFEKKSREFKALIAIGKDKGLNKKDTIKFAAAKMTERYGDSEILFDVSNIQPEDLGDNSDETQMSF